MENMDHGEEAICRLMHHANEIVWGIHPVHARLRLHDHLAAFMHGAMGNTLDTSELLRGLGGLHSSYEFTMRWLGRRPDLDQTH